MKICKNNLMFVCIHAFMSFTYWYFSWKLCIDFIDKNKMGYYFFTILYFIFYIGISYLLSGEIIHIGNLKTNICSVLLTSIILSLVWLFCLNEDDGRFFSDLVWGIYVLALGPFSYFSIEMFVSEGRILLEDTFVFLVSALIPSIFFWLGIELKAFYFRKHKRF